LTGYQPRTEQAKAAYENLLAIIGSKKYLGNQDPQVLRDAAELAITTLKDENMRDPERHEALSRLLTTKAAAARDNSSNGGLSTEAFSSLVKLGKEMDDYRTQDDNDGDEDSVNDEMGVAVVFDDSEEEGNDDRSESDAEVDVVVDSSSDSDSEKAKEDEEEDVDAAPDDDDEERVVQGGGETKKKTRAFSDRPLSVHEIDAHFLQRQLARHFDEADVAALRAQEVLEIIDIRSGSDIRECENRLIVLLGLEVANTIKLILQNRVRVWACVTLKRAQTDAERDEVQKALENDPTGEGPRVWAELHSRDRAENWTKERIKGMADSIKQISGDVSTALDSVMSGVKTGSADTPVSMEIETDAKKQAEDLDLEVLAFRDGAHTMSNKSCILPDTSWRATKKGYEEVHVPAVRTVIPKGEKLIPIKDLPSWTHNAFKGMDKLNRIQSKMCDVALKSSENLLLCAPTGAGKVRH
jgi:pre-mRNA-splicing helicase BRR2